MQAGSSGHGGTFSMHRTLAIVEREMRRFRRSPMLIVMSMIMPVMQLVILGHAFGGNVKHLRVAVVDQDRAVPAVRIRELVSAAASGNQVFDVVDYTDPGVALEDLRNGRVNGVLTIPPGFSRRVLTGTDPRVALIEDNTDTFVSASMAAAIGSLVGAFNQPAPSTRRASGAVTLDVVEVYPYVPYIQYLLPGSIVMSIFMMVMIGGGIIFIDDKARGLHEGYLVTPITKFELIAGFNISGTLRAMLAGSVILIIGSVIAGIPNPFDPMRILRTVLVIGVTSFALISMMFLLMARVTDPLMPRAMFGVLNTLLYFPSGAVYPQQGFPTWMQWIAVVDPFTYAVHAFKSLLLKNTGFGAIGFDLLCLSAFSMVAMTTATILFRRTL
jgi:ABC-2 type transport system permease protein